MISSRPADGATRRRFPNIGADPEHVRVPQRRNPQSGSGREHQRIHRALRMTVQRPEPGVVVVSMIGEIDLDSAPRIHELITQRLAAAALRGVVLDLSEVTFMGSSGLELLLRAQRRAQQRDIDLVIVAGSTSVRRLFTLTGMTEQFPRSDTVSDALAHLCH